MAARAADELNVIPVSGLWIETSTTYSGSSVGTRPTKEKVRRPSAASIAVPVLPPMVNPIAPNVPAAVPRVTTSVIRRRTRVQVSCENICLASSVAKTSMDSSPDSVEA